MAAITSSEIIIRPAMAMNQTDSAGGVMNGAIGLVDAVIGGVIADIDDAERVAGSTRRYKGFFHVANSENRPYKDAKIFLGDVIENIPESVLKGTQTDTWSTAKTGQKYGVGNLKTAVTAGATTVVVNTQGQSLNHFFNGALVVINSQLNPTDGTGKKDFLRVSNVTWSGDEATLTLSTPVQYDFPTSRTLNSQTIKTRVASVAEYGDFKATAVVSDKVSTNGTTNDSAIVVSHVGGIYQTLTFTMTSATTFSVVSSAGISMPTGQRNSTYAPTNPTAFQPYISIPSTFWGGTWATGDSFKVTTSPCAIPFWLQLNVASNTPAFELALLNVWVSGKSGTVL